MCHDKQHMPRLTSIPTALLALLVPMATMVSIAQASPPPHLLIRGNIVTPDGVLPGHWLDLAGHRIVQITKDKPAIPSAQVLETNDLILPGFIDLHNHPAFNVLPRWTPPHKFPNRYAWRDWPVYQQQLESKGRALSADSNTFCDVDEYAEVKALIGGTTSIIGLGSNHMPGESGAETPACIRGLVRNLDHYTGFYGDQVDHERIANSIGILPRDMSPEIADARARQIADGSLDLLAIHIAEGTDQQSSSELDLLEAHHLLGPHTALIHAVGLTPAQLAKVRKSGASIVWSPRSNFELYGETANLNAAFRQGVTLSLAPDWSPSGSDNMWEEIQYAWEVNNQKLDRLFSSHQLFEMASSIPARVATIDDKIGALSPGMYADLMLVHGVPDGPASSLYDSLIAKSITAIDLVVIDGIPVYGDPALLHSLQIPTETLLLCGTEKALNSAALPNGPFAAVESRLRTKLKAIGTDLGPLDSCSQP